MLAQQRTEYQAAKTAASRGDWAQFRSIRAGLDDYPLAIYLDFLELNAHVHELAPARVQSFLSRAQGSALPNRLLSRYLADRGRREAWEDFLAVMPAEPNSIDLKCYYFRARLARGDRSEAFAGARRLWVHGQSRPEACDPLFASWMAAGELDDESVWGRLLAVFDARERGLMNYVVNRASAELRPAAERLRAVHAQPDRLRSLVPPGNDLRTGDTVARGVAYLARYREREALQHWQTYQKEMRFTPEQTLLAESGIALRSLFARSEANLPWVEEALFRLGDDSIVELRLRWAIAEQDWTALLKAHRALGEAGQARPEWRYWQARALEEQGEAALAAKLFTQLASERDYHGFLAAQRLGLAPSLQHRAAPAPKPLGDELAAGFARVAELVHHDEVMLAHSEWAALLQGRGPDTLLALAVAAAGNNWYRKGIDAVSRAEAWDYLELRFPLAWRETFERYGALRGVPGSELMAIARRESAFFPGARSPVGARGLMQVMPATASQVARQLQVRHSSEALYSIDHNVMLASAYYRELLDRYQGNRIFAMAAYNAGPARVARWRNAQGDGVPADVWVATIPFRETRNYVQNVLAYNLIFQHLAGEHAALLREDELRHRY